MSPLKLPLLLFGFIILGTILTDVRAMPVDDNESPVNGIDNDVFEEEISADKNELVDDEEVEEGDAEERNILNELDPKAEEKDAEIAEEESDLDSDELDEEEFEEEIADAEEEEDINEEEEESVADEEEAIEEEEKAIADEEEAIASEEEEVAEAEEKAAEEEGEATDDDEKTDEKTFPYNWYDKVKQFFKGQK